MLEVIVVPVADVERAKAFYVEALNFVVDHDTVLPGGARLVQLTPPGSKCSITIGTVGPSSSGVQMAPGSLQGMQLVVSDLQVARRTLIERGVRVGAVEVFDGGALRPYREGDALDNVGFLRFSDPDGNGWAVQQISSRAGAT